MSKKFWVGILTALSVLFVSNGNLVHAEENNRLDAEKIYEIHKEYVLSEYGEEAGFAIESYGDSGIDSRLTRALFPPPTCVHGSEVFEWNEYKAFTWNGTQHTQNTYRVYTYLSCGCSGTLKMTDNPWVNHDMHYVDMGHRTENTHYYDYRCVVCGYTKYTRYLDCPGLKTGQHVRP